MRIFCALFYLLVAASVNLVIGRGSLIMPSIFISKYLYQAFIRLLLSHLCYTFFLLSDNTTDSRHIREIDPGFCYVLAYSWTAEFCGNKPYPGCEKPKPYWLNNFTLHGLWPQFTDSTGYPSFCDKDPFNPEAPIKVGMDKMVNYWPNVKYAEGDPNYDSFWVSSSFNYSNFKFYHCIK